MILETAVGRAPVCAFPAFWLDVTTRQTAFCNEEQRRQRVGKACDRACSGVTHLVHRLTINFFNKFMNLSKLTCGQLPFLGLYARI
jgi:hypothetical protein